jgi:hypothetical protein
MVATFTVAERPFHMSDQRTPPPADQTPEQPSVQLAGSPYQLPGITSTWAVTFTIGMDSNGFTIIFSQPIYQPGLSGTVATPIVPTMAVTLSPILAKDLARILKDAVERYEKHMNYTIPPPSTTPIT